MTTAQKIVRGCGTVSLLLLTILVSYAALCARPDSWEEVRRGEVTDWFILGPLWASITFLSLYGTLRTHPRKRGIAIGVSIIVWVAVAFTANWWEKKKLRVWLDYRRNYQKHPERNSSSDTVGRTNPKP